MPSKAVPVSAAASAPSCTFKASGAFDCTGRGAAAADPYASPQGMQPAPQSRWVLESGWRHTNPRVLAPYPH